MFKRTYPGAAFNADGRHVGPGPWLDVIRKVNGLAHDEGLDSLFGAPTYTDDRPGVEQYPDADVTHDYPLHEPPFPPDIEHYGWEWEAIARERAKVRDEWLRDPRNTVTITSKTPLGERLLVDADVDRYGRTWGLAPEETCSECGQPDNCGDCEHGRLDVADVVLLGGRVSDAEWDLLPADVRDSLDPGGA